MMRLKEGELEIYEKIDLYNRYKSIVNLHRYQDGLELLEKVDKQIILQMIEDIFRVKAKYFGKEKFYQIKLVNGEVESIYNICLQYGSVESIFWIKSSLSDSGYGNQIVTMLRLIDKEYGKDTSSSEIGQPCFKNYEELREILTELKPLFEDFKNEFLSSGILEKNI